MPLEFSLELPRKTGRGWLRSVAWDHEGRDSRRSRRFFVANCVVPLTSTPWHGRNSLTSSSLWLKMFSSAQS